MSKISKRPTIQMPTAEEDKAITAAAKSDPDALPLTPKQLKAMVPIRALRGRPKSENKKLLVSVRYSPEVVAFFKSTGEGWQARMDGVLRNYVTRHSRNVT
ncbi:MAG: BrnA antitoxin family protein [Sideroxydans sp.]